jgi:multidrug resistance efflux pump
MATEEQKAGQSEIEPETETGQEDAQTPPKDTAKPDPVRRFTRIVLIVLVVLFIWYVLADRYAPWTDQARVVGFTVPIASKVSGRVKAVHVSENDIVQPGDLLLEIGPREYQLALQRAEASLDIAGQSTGADTAGVKASEASLGKARAQLKQAERDFDRVERIYKQDPGAVSANSRDQAKSALAQARSQEANAVAELERAKEQLGKGGKENARVRDATAALEQARIDLAETKIYAPSLGGITNLRLDEGHYASRGAPLMTFVSFDGIWIQANMRENNMAGIEAGASVDIALDQLPGRVFKGTVASKGFAVKQPSYGATGELINIKGDSSWMRDAQRFPIIIHFADEGARGYRLVGAQADVQVYGSNAILNGLGWLWIRLMSLLSFIY